MKKYKQTLKKDQKVNDVVSLHLYTGAEGSKLIREQVKGILRQVTTWTKGQPSWSQATVRSNQKMILGAIIAAAYDFLDDSSLDWQNREVELELNGQRICTTAFSTVLFGAICIWVAQSPVEFEEIDAEGKKFVSTAAVVLSIHWVSNDPGYYEADQANPNRLLNTLAVAKAIDDLK